MIINLSKIDFGGVTTGGKSKPEEVFDVQPTTSDQIITPTEGSVFSGGTVRAVTSEIDNNIVPENIKQGVSILGVAGTLEEGITPAGTKTITDNGTYDVTNYASAEVNVGGTPDYHYMNGTVDRAGLKAIGWTDEDILTYEQNIPSHYTWQNDQYKVSDENKALYLLDDPNPSSYKNNPNIEYVPKKNMELYFAKAKGFQEMQYIKGIPFYDTSNMTSTSYLFQGCTNLLTIPLLDTSNVTNLSTTFSGCQNLTSIPQLNTSKAIYMSYTFSACSKLLTIPQLDTSNVTSMMSAFIECSNLLTIPQLNTSNVTNMSYMFSKCSNLTSIPQLNTSNVINMSYMFNECTSLTTIPLLDTSNATNMERAFYGCSKLTNIPPLDTSKVTNMKFLLGGCSKLATVEGVDFSGLTSSLTNLFGWDSTRSNVTRFIVNGKINVSISDNYGIKALTAIDYDSVKSILAAADRTDNTNVKTLTFNRTMTDQNGELAALVASCTSKGWTITGLTLQ